MATKKHESKRVTVFNATINGTVSDPGASAAIEKAFDAFEDAIREATGAEVGHARLNITRHREPA